MPATLEFVPFDPPPSAPLTSEEVEIFKSEDDKNVVGTERQRVVRLGAALIGFHYNPYGTPPPEYAMLKHVAETYVIVHHDGQTRRLPLVPKHSFRTLIPSPSGQRFLVFNDKGPLPDGTVVIGGHVLEADLASLETSVALTGTTGRTAKTLGSKASADAMTLSDVDYVDDDTLIVALTQRGVASLVLYERDPTTRSFVEAHRVDAPPERSGVRVAGGLIATRGSGQLTVFGVDDHQLVERGTVATPAEHGTLVAHPEDARHELVFSDQTSHFRLVHHAA